MTDLDYQVRRGVRQLTRDVTFAGYRFAIWSFVHPTGVRADRLTRHWGLVLDPNAPGKCQVEEAAAVAREVWEATGGTALSHTSSPMLRGTPPLDHYRWHDDGSAVASASLAAETRAIVRWPPALSVEAALGIRRPAVPGGP